MWTKVKPLMQRNVQVHVLNSPYGAVIKQNFRDEFVDVLHFTSCKSKTSIFKTRILLQFCKTNKNLVGLNYYLLLGNIYAKKSARRTNFQLITSFILNLFQRMQVLQFRRSFLKHE